MNEEDMKKLDELISMPLHSSIEVRTNPINGTYMLEYAITRVFGGWIYTNSAGRCTFIPCHK